MSDLDAASQLSGDKKCYEKQKNNTCQKITTNASSGIALSHLQFNGALIFIVCHFFLFCFVFFVILHRDRERKKGTCRTHVTPELKIFMYICVLLPFDTMRFI